jgi:TRAP-type C4-dicarboxylate transport system substrate-binding protein
MNATNATRAVGGIVVAGLTALAAPLRAEPHMLKIATAAPEGTAWARAARSFSRDVEAASGGEIKVKWYFGGITGDELQTSERIRKEQLDGTASGGVLCERLAPSMRVLRVVGLVQNRDEAAYLLGRLRRVLDHEFRKSGFTSLIEVGLGPDILFTRQPVRNMAELRRGRYWIWDLDEVFRAQLPWIGITTRPLPLEAAAAAYEQGEVDGFIAVPTAALAFQWSAQARYVSELHLGWISACLLVADRAFDALPATGQQLLRTAAAKLHAQMEDLGRQQDDALLGGLFQKQGLTTVPVSESFRAEFLETARANRERLGDLVPEALLLQVSSWLADYRAEHRAPEHVER